MLKTLAALLALAAAVASQDARAACVGRDRMSNCFEPRGNAALSRPNRQLLRMPEIDPRVASPRLRKPVAPAVAPAVRAERRRTGLLHWSQPAGRKRFFNPCTGPTCDRFGNRPACRGALC